jgi:23S rRNA pseudouridine2605 synthase
MSRDGKNRNPKGRRNERRGKPKPGFRGKKGKFDNRSKKKFVNPNDELIRLNKYIAHSGVCSRREADTLISQGLITVNGEVVTELGTKVKRTDEVKYAGERLNTETLRYVLLNKPKDYITTSKDPQNRKTVMHLVEKACKERLFSVGRLDRHTTGVLLLTNDGDLAKKLTHPSHGVNKVYHVVLDKNLKPDDFDKIANGLELKDGKAQVDKIAYVDGKKSEIGLELHIGRNRIVRRIFEHLGYTVVKLDRVSFAGLTKKNIPRGKFRHLKDKEINFLKMTIK